MPNLNQAPTLYHKGKKIRDNNKGTTIIPDELFRGICHIVGDRKFAMFKLIIFLIGCNGEGKFKVPIATVVDRCSISEASYKSARKGLVEMGWIEHEPGESITVNFDKIYGDIDKLNDG